MALNDADYVRLCPVCGFAATPDEAQCGHCGTLLLGVDLSLRTMLPAPPPTAPAVAAVLPGPHCPYPDCGAENPPESTHCIYCDRPLAVEKTTADVGATPATLFRLPAALAARYRIVEVLPASGGEAEIMVLADTAEATDTGNRVVAKLYRPGFKPRPEVMERVARAAFRHVVRLLDWGESEGIGYEVMEYCPHGSLRALAQTGPLRRDRLRAVLVEIADALVALHAQGVIHRDLKPENVLVRQLDPLDLALTDFGIASVAETTQVFTSLARSVRYGAPETLTGVLDRAADWWSLGMIVAELYAGRHPFADLSDAVITHRLVTGAPDLAEVDDPDWSRLCRGLLLRDPQRRWGGDEVRRWLAGDASLRLPETDLAAPLAHAARPYRIEGKLCATPLELALALSEHWEAGRNDLKRGQLAAWIGQELKDDDLLRFVQDQFERRDSSDDMRLLRLIRRMAPDAPPAWRGASLLVPALVAQAVHAERGDAAAARWLVTVYGEKVLRELPAARFPAEATLVARWEAARARLDALWRQAETHFGQWQRRQRPDGAVDVDALIYGQSDTPAGPSPERLHPPLLLALADETYARTQARGLRTTLHAFIGDMPWLAPLLDDEDAAALTVAHLLLPRLRREAEQLHRVEATRLATRTAERAALVGRVNAALALLRETCDLGLLAGEAARQRTAAAVDGLLALIAEARGEGLPDSTPLLRTASRAEPLALRIQDRLDDWEHAARINALWRNPNLIRGGALFLFLLLVFDFGGAFMQALAWIGLAIAALAGWRLHGLKTLRDAIRELARTLPLRIPTGAG